MNIEIKSPLLLFDGVCNLCNHAVQWVLRHDTQGQFQFASLQSALGQSLLQHFGLDARQLSTVVLVVDDQVFTHSDAPLEVMRRLGGGWGMLYALRVLPKALRDGVYDWVARNRYRWFGQRESCVLPRPEWKGRFLG